MPGMTLRLDDDDHTRLRLLSIAAHKPANQIITELLRAEADRVLGRRSEAHTPALGSDRLRQALGWGAQPQAEADLDAGGARAEADVQRI